MAYGPVDMCVDDLSIRWCRNDKRRAHKLVPAIYYSLADYCNLHSNLQYTMLNKVSIIIKLTITGFFPYNTHHKLLRGTQSYETRHKCVDFARGSTGAEKCQGSRILEYLQFCSPSWFAIRSSRKLFAFQAQWTFRTTMRRITRIEVMWKALAIQACVIVVPGRDLRAHRSI